MAITDKLKELVDNKWFTHLVDEKDLEVYEKHLSEYLLPSYSDVRIELAKTFSTGKKWYGIHFPGAPISLNLSGLIDAEDFFIKIRNYIIFFEDDFSSPSREVLIHEPFMIENSYDSDFKVRSYLKQALAKFYLYDKDFLTSSLDIFDGANINYVERINIDRKNLLNSFSCYEVPDYDVPEFRDFTRNKDVIQRLGSLYNINEKPLNDLIEQLKPVLSDNSVRITFSLNQNGWENPEVFGITLSPHYSTEEYNDIVARMCDTFCSLQMITPEEYNDLKSWTDFKDRILTGFSLQISNKGKTKIDTSFSAHFGFIPTIIEPEQPEFNL